METLQEPSSRTAHVLKGCTPQCLKPLIKTHGSSRLMVVRCASKSYTVQAPNKMCAATIVSYLHVATVSLLFLAQIVQYLSMRLILYEGKVLF